MLRARFASRRGEFLLDAALEAAEGSTLVLVGESGAGKSTVLRMLAGLDHPENGLVDVSGDLWYDSARGIRIPAGRRSIGWVSQDYALFPHLTAGENVEFGLRASGVPAARARARALELLERFGLAAELPRRPAALSGGQQQRVALARALVLEPRLLLLDEPLSALDPGTRREVRGLLKAVLRERRTTTVYVTHSPLEALALGERIAVMERGRIVQDGMPADLLRHPRSAGVAEFLGVNLFQGTIGGRREEGLVEVKTARGSVTAVDPGGADEVFVAVNPKEIVLSLDPPAGSARNVFRGRVTEIVPEPPAGERIRVALATEPPLVAEVTPQAVHALGLAEGVEVYAAFKATGVLPYR